MFVLVLCFCVIVGVFGTDFAYTSCGEGKYYDEVTRVCSHCTDICVNAEMQGTQEACDTHCPGYSKHTSDPSPVEAEKTDRKMYIIAIVVVPVVLVGAIVVTVKRQRIRELLGRRTGRGPADNQENIPMRDFHHSNPDVSRERGNEDPEVPQDQDRHADNAVPGTSANDGEQTTLLKRYSYEEDDHHAEVARPLVLPTQPEQDPEDTNLVCVTSASSTVNQSGSVAATQPQQNPENTNPVCSPSVAPTVNRPGAF